MRFAGKRVLVTGAGSNDVGRAIATSFAREGADVVIHYQGSANVAAEVIEEIECGGQHAIALGADLCTSTDARQLVCKAAERLGGLDILVTAVASPARIREIDEPRDEWVGPFPFDQTSTAACVSQAAQIMQASGQTGRIIMVDFATRAFSCAGNSSEISSQDLLTRLSREVGRDLAQHGITINVVTLLTSGGDAGGQLPGDIEIMSKLLGKIPMARFGDPSEAVEAVFFFAGTGAGYVTGNLIACDGGLALS